ncbi:FAD-binding and (Fe-S)-binding domain-containing protein [Stieleria marina]|uniref:Anaerobic glycerol-3-phosphate dehydrogenase subunit C n=1 Tax=Stieleria marina TaxID=1930275 RepID=A0A517P387_9BACT|nr:Anaerobic glycerol-3-phosphate dehydrogenase subunit C [Planctomycetes bacterium K23_9]
MNVTPDALIRLSSDLDGELHSGELMRQIYSTDASAYQELPLAVAIPKNESDLRKLIRFANEQHVGLIPRTAGTSLAGQVVGSGIVVDVSRQFTAILEINADESWVRVEPGVIRNELNLALQPHGLLFGPETSTQNRAMMGGMLGNNSCGSNSIKYGSTRDHVLEVTALLSDGSQAVFGPLNAEEFAAKCDGPDSVETQLYRDIRDLLADQATRDEITKEFPKPSIPRRNTGYAIDLLMDANCIDSSSDKPFHFGKLIAGSEGTLCFVTEMKLRCLPLPPPENGLLCVHFNDVDEALRATQIAVQHDCYACELIDRYILECTRRSIEHRENRFFIQGDPGAILVIDIRGQDRDEILSMTNQIESDLRSAGLGTAFPVLFGSDTVKIWNLRKAGLGLLGNLPGDAKPAPVIEDTAVDVDDLPQYIAEFNEILNERFQLQCVHYAHAGSGEIHLRPILNLKTTEGTQLFREVAQTIATLVKEYRGSLSGEHGDGRLRGEFLCQMIGEKNYDLVKRIKQSWDPAGVFNPGKIVDTPPMNGQLRYTPGHQVKPIKTVFDWSSTIDVLGAAEMCNGSGDCRKTQLSGGVMCPSYMATRNEKDTTRARANMLRHAMTHAASDNPFDNEELKDVLDLCLSCKGCKKECPSTVDMAKLKAEFQQHYYDANGSPLRAKMIANFAKSQRLLSVVPWAWNAIVGTKALRRVMNRMIGFHPERTIPKVARTTLRRWFDRHQPSVNVGKTGQLVLLCDEFTNFTDADIGIKTVELLESLGYKVELSPISESGRTWLSKGFLRKAKEIVNGNTTQLSDLVNESVPLVGIEPSAILTFRDESIDLATDELKASAIQIAEHCFTLEEFLAREFADGRINSDSFTDQSRSVLLHGHCFQKALTDSQSIIDTLSLPANYSVSVIPSGCCGMAGSFGYEKEHYDLSMQIGELVLFPALRDADAETLIAAPGTSCRHQIHDGTSKRAMHPAEILHAALKD